MNPNHDLIGSWPPQGTFSGSSEAATDDAAARPSAPTERRDIAVALSHDASGGSDLPRVIAAGKGAIARQILEIAFARGIKVREDADLAEVLAAVEVDSEIPLTAFAAVAEILSYVYRTQASSQPQTPKTTSAGDAP